MSLPRLQPRRLVLEGSILVDILLYIDHLPERGGDTIAQNTLLTTGGGFNVLVGALRLDMPVAHAGRVGSGPMGTQVMTDLTAAGIPCLLPQISGEDTGFDIGLVEPDAERTFVTSPGTESRLQLADLHAIPLLAGDAIYLSGYDLCYPISGAALEAWVPTLSQDYLLIFDPGPLVGEIPDDRLGQVLARCDIVSLNAREISILTGSTDISEAANRLVSRLADGGHVVARAGDQGCWIASSAHSPIHIPARTVQPVDTTGAGDAHIAALLARLAVGDTMYRAAEIANIAASSAVERRGPATGPTSQQLASLL